MSYDMDNGPTLIYSDEPNLAVDVTDQSGRIRYNASQVARATNAETARISASQVLPGQIIRRPAPPRRPVQANPQMPAQAPVQPVQPEQPAPAPAPAPVQAPPPPPPPQQQYYQQQYAYPQQQYYQQQPAYYPPQPPMPPEQGAEDLADGESNGIAPNFPSYEMILVNDTYHLYVDLPGVKKSDIDMKFSGGNLYISGHRDLKCKAFRPGKSKGRGNKGKKPHYEAMVGVRGYQLGEFNFPFYFPNPVDTGPDSFKADMSDGILHVEMKLASVATGISINIR